LPHKVSLSGLYNLILVDKSTLFNYFFVESPSSPPPPESDDQDLSTTPPFQPEPLPATTTMLTLSLPIEEQAASVEPKGSTFNYVEYYMISFMII